MGEIDERKRLSRKSRNDRLRFLAVAVFFSSARESNAFPLYHCVKSQPSRSCMKQSKTRRTTSQFGNLDGWPERWSFGATCGSYREHVLLVLLTLRSRRRIEEFQMSARSFCENWFLLFPFSLHLNQSSHLKHLQVGSDTL